MASILTSHAADTTTVAITKPTTTNKPKPSKATGAGWAEIKPVHKISIPEGIWQQCDSCKQMVYREHLKTNQQVCPECNHHHRISATQRVEMLADKDSFRPLFTNLRPTDPLGFRDLKTYTDRLAAEQIKSGMNEAALAGEVFIKGRSAALCCLDSSFMLGSMGSVVGEVLTRTIEHATKFRCLYYRQWS